MSKYNKEVIRRWQKANPDKVKTLLQEWRKANPDKVKAINAKYREKHREKAKETSRMWRQNNSDQHKETHKNYYLLHKEHNNEKSKKWRQANPQKHQECCKRWLKTPKGRIIRHARVDKRKRNMGSNILNSWFPGCNRHHITINDIICIPEDVHKSIKHNYKNPESMNKINIIAWSIMESSCY